MNTVPTNEGDQNLSFVPLQGVYNSTSNTIINHSLLHENIEREVTGAQNEEIDLLLTVALPGELKSSVPLTLCCVLDVSGSMSGDKLLAVKQAMKYVIDKLTSNDNLIIISFDDQAVVELASTKQDLSGKAAAMKVISQLSIRGGTDIVAGLQTTISEIESSRNRNGYSNFVIFLLTDGQDGKKITPTNDPYSNIIASAKSLECPIYTYGFGADHDANVMNHIADKTNGTFTYAKNIQSINTSFLKAFGVVAGIVTKNMVLSATVPTPATGILSSGTNYVTPGSSNQSFPYGASVAGGVKLSNFRLGFFPYRIQNSMDTDKSDMVVKVGTVAVSEWRQILVRLHLPPIIPAELIHGADGVREATHWVLDVQVRFTELSTNHDYISPIHHIVIRRVYEDNAGIEFLKNVKCSVSVEVARVRAEAMAAVERSIKRANTGKFAEAKQLLADALRLLKVNPLFNRHEMPNALYRDVEELSRHLSSWNHGGYAHALAFLSTHSTQRSTDTELSSGKLYVTKEQEKVLNSSNVPLSVIATSNRSSDPDVNNSVETTSGFGTALRSNDTFVGNNQRYEGKDPLPVIIDHDQGHNRYIPVEKSSTEPDVGDIQSFSDVNGVVKKRNNDTDSFDTSYDSGSSYNFSYNTVGKINPWETSSPKNYVKPVDPYADTNYGYTSPNSTVDPYSFSGSVSSMVVKKKGYDFDSDSNGSNTYPSTSSLNTNSNADITKYNDSWGNSASDSSSYNSSTFADYSSSSNPFSLPNYSNSSNYSNNNYSGGNISASSTSYEASVDKYNDPYNMNSYSTGYDNSSVTMNDPFSPDHYASGLKKKESDF